MSTSGKSGTNKWKMRLTGLPELRDGTVQSHQDLADTNGNRTAVREDASLTLHPLGVLDEEPEGSGVKHLDTHYPEKIPVTDYERDGETIERWNSRAVPGRMKGDEKIKILEACTACLNG